MVSAEQRLFRSVSHSSKTLTDQAEHVFRNMFRANSRRGRLRPPHWAEQNTFSLVVFRCFARRTNTSAQWKNAPARLSATRCARAGAFHARLDRLKTVRRIQHHPNVVDNIWEFAVLQISPTLDPTGSSRPININVK